MPWKDLCPWALSGPSFRVFVLKHRVGQIPWSVRELCGQYEECVCVCVCVCVLCVCVCVCVFAGNIPVLRQQTA